MKKFEIYAFVVTGLYILYMSAVIMKDLFGKKGQKARPVIKETLEDCADISVDAAGAVFDEGLNTI